MKGPATVMLTNQALVIAEAKLAGISLPDCRTRLPIAELAVSPAHGSHADASVGFSSVITGMELEALYI